MAIATLNGIDLHYDRTGSGPPLLFITGTGGSRATSEYLIAPFRDHFDVLAFDQRGLGDTSVPPGPYSMAGYAADALALLDHVGWDRCRLFGISFGGMVAQEIAVTAPDRIERLALICTSAGGAGGSSYPLHDLLDLDPKERLARSTLLLDTRFDEAWLADHPRDRAMIEFRDAQAAVPRSTEQLRGERLQIEARSHHDVWDRLPRITCPTMVAGGRYDGIAPPANSEAIASRLPDAQLRLYEGGHLFIVQDPAALPDIVTFLSV